MLFTYAALDFYVADKGTLAFLITQEFFKSKGRREGFRRFRLGNRTPFRILKAHDLVAVQPFEGAANKTAILVARKASHELPRPVHRLDAQAARRPQSSPPTPPWRGNVSTEKTRLLAQPWVAPPAPGRRSAQINGDSHHQGENAYQARRGASVEPYGVFCLGGQEVLHAPHAHREEPVLC